MRGNHALIGILLAAVAALFVFGAQIGRTVGSVFRNSVTLEREGVALEGKIAELEAELATQGAFRGIKTEQDTVLSFVYSRYPFNFKDELYISGGLASGMKEGSAVFLDGIFIGLVKDVFHESAIVRTIFDSRSRFAVRIGEEQTDALLVGGSSPRVTLISRDATVNEGDIVYTAHHSVPYGTAIGYISKPMQSEDALFKEAVVRVPIDFSDIRAVKVAITPVSQ